MMERKVDELVDMSIGGNFKLVSERVSRHQKSRSWFVCFFLDFIFPSS